MTTDLKNPDEIEKAHHDAVSQWLDYFKLSCNTTPEQSLLSTLADELGLVSRADWSSVLAGSKLLLQSDSDEMHHLLNTPPHQLIPGSSHRLRAQALFLLVLPSLRHHDESDVQELARLSQAFSVQSSGINFVKRVWDGYFYFACSVARIFSATQPSDWTWTFQPFLTTIPTVGVGTR